MVDKISAVVCVVSTDFEPPSVKLKKMTTSSDVIDEKRSPVLLFCGNTQI